MNSPNSYPTGAEAVDNHLSEAINALRGDVRDGFNRVDNTVRDMVTKGEFNAEVKRIDGEIKRVDAQNLALRDHMDAQNASLEKTVRDGFSNQAKEADAKQAKNRWAMGWIVSLVAVVVSAIGSIVMKFI